MGHYALLDSNNVVVQVITGADEKHGSYDWEQLYTKETGHVCKKTSYNTVGGKHTAGGEPYRKNYAGIGYTYDPQRDAFIPPKTFNSWVLNEESCQWEPPIPHPVDTPDVYIWNEETTSWDVIHPV